MVLAERAEMEIPRSFISRRSTFKAKLLLRLGTAMDCVQPLEKSPSERKSLLIPTILAKFAASKLNNEKADTDDLLPMPRYEPQEDIFFFSAPCSIEDMQGFHGGAWSPKCQCQ